MSSAGLWQCKLGQLLCHASSLCVTPADTVTPESLRFKCYSCLDALHREAIKSESCHLFHLAFLMKVAFLF